MRVRNAAIVIGAVLAVVVTVGLVRLIEEPAPEVADAPAETPAPEEAPGDDPTASGPTPSPEPLEGPPPEDIEELAEQVTELRELPLLEPLDARTVPREELGARFAEQSHEELDPDDIAADERLLAALRLIEPDVDLESVLEAFYTEQVLGMYSSDEEILYVGADDPALSPSERITAAHEITHALQDQHWDLSELLDMDDRSTDQQLAALALVEGDAVLVQELWALSHLSEAERGQAQQEALDQDTEALDQAPPYVRDSILFPYREGPLFVQALVQHGGFAAVDEAFENLPASTAEIMDPMRYLEGWEPEQVRIEVEPDEGWESAGTYELGAFDLRHLFGPARADGGVVEGWSGGEVRHWQRGEEDAVAVAVRFEDPDAATAACDATPAWYADEADGEPAGEDRMQGDRDWLSWTCTDLGLHLGLGPDEQTATTLAAP